jgi:hypothetical protein
MIASSDCRQIRTSGLILVSSNPQPLRELQYPNTWLMHSRDRGDFMILVLHDDLNRPHVLHKEAA